MAEEQFRDVVRAREDVRGDLMRARHRLSKFLLRREVVYPGPGGAWTQTHMTWLARLGFRRRRLDRHRQRLPRRGASAGTAA